MQTWIENEISLGLQKLLTLSLNHQPALDVIDATGMVWREAITHGRSWSEGQDAPRFREAFATLAATFDEWPKPSQFLAALPPRREVMAPRVEMIESDEQKALRAERQEQSRLRVQAIIAGIAKDLRVSP